MERYAVIQNGGKQYRVKEGDIVRLERFAEKTEGDKVEMQVLAAHNDGAINLEGGTATGTIVAEGRDKKIIVFKKRRTTTYRRTNGHRQNFHDVRIDGIPTV
ncbi:MAG: 50S ribosomal protein L21 [Acidobacteria bacterium]|nr:50S ribosomal protein L21 [Acidobacteriota bacterium]